MTRQADNKRPGRFEIKISLGGAAFGADPRPEIRAILMDLVDRLHNSADAYILRDHNGRMVGNADFRPVVYYRVH